MNLRHRLMAHCQFNHHRIEIANSSLKRSHQICAHGVVSEPHLVVDQIQETVVE